MTPTQSRFGRRLKLGLICGALLACAVARGAEPLDVWIDCDPAFGAPGKDVDDGLALIQAIHSPELRIHGVSVVFGNVPQEHGMRIASRLLGQFGPEGLPLYPGASGPEQRGQENEATTALVKALADRPMHLLALGPVTNIATVIQNRPDLKPRILSIVCVAGRRPGQKFMNAPRQPYPHRDLNFELDPEAMRVLLESGVKIVLAPWEVSSHVWITRKDLDQLATDVGGTGAHIAEKSRSWIVIWKNIAGAHGFNPFDTLAVGWLTRPELMQSFEAGAWIEEAPDDRVFNERPPGLKPYLFVDPMRVDAAPVTYLHKPDSEFHDDLIRRLRSPKKPEGEGAPSVAAHEEDQAPAPAASGEAR